jgi:hypothetical protein
MAESLEQVRTRRDYECRLTPDRALDSVDQAHGFLRERGLLTLTPDSALPSLYVACHEEPYQAGGRGFASWPATKWWWPSDLASRPDVHSLKVHRGNNVLLSDDVLPLADPICRSELGRAERQDPVCARVLRHLAEAGPSIADDVEVELGLNHKEFRSLRAALQRCGALVARPVILPAGSGDGHVHRSELARWDQAYPEAAPGPPDVVALMGAALRAAVLAPEKELARWFTWRWLLPDHLAGRLIDRGLAARPAPGWLAAPPGAGP